MAKRIEYSSGDIVNSGIVFIADAGTIKRKRRCIFKCHCGTEFSTTLYAVRSGATRSCGCVYKATRREINKKHGDYRDPLYKAYTAMKSRCKNANNPNYHRYGGRGITVCQEWEESYIAFKRWAINNGYKKGLSLDREDNMRGYSPDNCRFVTQKENCQNTSASRRWYTPDGVFSSLREAREFYGKDVHGRFRGENPNYYSEPKYK